MRWWAKVTAGFVFLATFSTGGCDWGNSDEPGKARKSAFRDIGKRSASEWR